uniref:Odorant receptor n=1 Tax=Histia rhodope TaxID=1453155 RepID=A0A7G4KBW8_9NEOP|nr:odorant receptor [Histia rhodope]
MSSLSSHRAIKLFRRMCCYAYVTGLPNFWYEKPNWSIHVGKFHDFISHVTDVINCVFYLGQFFSFFTQKNLNERQETDQIIFTTINPCIYWAPIAMNYYKEQVRDLIRNLVLVLPSVYNDREVERKMVKKSCLYVSLLLSTANATLLLYGIDSFIKVLKGAVFTTVITAWPSVEDRSRIAGIGRAAVFIIWTQFMFRSCGAISLIISLTINTSHQYIQLQSYFRNLSNIFQENLIQEEMETKYEEHLKIGIQQHIKILSYTKKLKQACILVYGGQIFTNMVILVMTMMVMMGDDLSLTKLMTFMTLAISSTVTNGFYMCTIGDITVEVQRYGSQ